MSKIVNAIESFSGKEERMIVIGSSDIDAVDNSGVGRTIYDSHNDSRIGNLIQFRFLKNGLSEGDRA